MLKKVLMVLKRTEMITLVLIVLFAAVVALTAGQIIKAKVAKDARNAQQTDIEVRAMVGIPAENKLGGMEFGVSDHWNYHRIIFRVCGFTEGLNLDHVVCKGDDGERSDFDPNHPEWNLWLARYQGVLIVATVGEENAYLIDKTQSP